MKQREYPHGEFPLSILNSLGKLLSGKRPVQTFACKSTIITNNLYQNLYIGGNVSRILFVQGCDPLAKILLDGDTECPMDFSMLGKT